MTAQAAEAPRLFVTPSLKLTGGNLEIVRLARDVADAGMPVRLVAMWRAEHQADTGGLPVTYLSGSRIGAATAVAQIVPVA